MCDSIFFNTYISRPRHSSNTPRSNSLFAYHGTQPRATTHPVIHLDRALHYTSSGRLHSKLIMPQPKLSNAVRTAGNLIAAAFNRSTEYLFPNFDVPRLGLILPDDDNAIVQRDPVSRGGSSNRCHLLSLTADVQVRIYRIVSCFNQRQVFAMEGVIYAPTSERDRSPTGSTRTPALLRTCHAIHAEALGVLYDQTGFSVALMEVDLFREYWLDFPGQRARGHTRRSSGTGCRGA